jgi:excinuclease ABC subunit B
VLLGATGTGKTATVAWLAEQVQRPILVLQPNKTLAAQFANELREFFPDNAVEYFVSYYDYYQPEAYIPQTDTYIEKDSSINEEVERLRHSATNSLLTRRDVDRGLDGVVHLRPGDPAGVRRPDGSTRWATSSTATRCCAVGGDPVHAQRHVVHPRHLPGARRHVEIFPVYEEMAIRVEFFGDEIERLMTCTRMTGEVLTEDQELYVFPATHYVAGPERMERAIAGSRPSSRSSLPSSRARASCWRPSGCGCAPPTTSR